MNDPVTSICLPSLEQIALVTDFGQAGPYLGQMEAVLHAAGLTQPLIRLLADAPAFDPRATAYLLRALVAAAPAPTLYLSVVDPGVGSRRRPLIVHAGGHCFVGPDNGLFAPLIRHRGGARAWVIDWRPQVCSASFHGRDLFAPVAARIAAGRPVPAHSVALESLVGWDWPERLEQVIYLDHYGNAFTGIPAEGVPETCRLMVNGQSLRRARIFSDVPEGTPFWYPNSLGLVEIAVARGRADQRLGLAPGTPVALLPGD